MIVFGVFQSGRLHQSTLLLAEALSTGVLRWRHSDDGNTEAASVSVAGTAERVVLCEPLLRLVIRPLVSYTASPVFEQLRV